jgi:hypothetical protein
MLPWLAREKQMKAIINGLRYDTATAVEIGSANAGLGRGDFRWYDEALYRTPRSGRYFLAGEGGALTRYSQSVPGGGSTSGKRIVTLSPEEALEWAEQNLTAAEIEEAFGDKVEDA